MKTCSCQEKAYIAGFLDGDGCINAQIIKRPDYVLKYQIRVSICFFQKTKRHWFLIRLDKQLRCGTLRKRPDGMSEYSIVGIHSVANTLKALYPYLQLKKPHARLLLDIIENMPGTKKDAQNFLNLCEKVDRLAHLNDSKKRVITAQTVRSELGL
jgi:LAGLIDADG endonuclease